MAGREYSRMAVEMNEQPKQQPAQTIVVRSSPDRRNHKVRPAEFRQRVRKYPRDALLRGIARASAEQALDRDSLPSIDRQWSAVQEGYLFQIAGICVTSCNNYRGASVDDDAVRDLVDGFFGVWEADLDGPHDEDSWQRIWSRFAYLQAPYQQSLREPLVRTLCLFGDDPRFGPPVLVEGRWEEILGVTLPRFLMIGFFMYTAAIRLPGGVSRAALEIVFEKLGTDDALQVVDSWLARPVDDLVRLGRQNTTSPMDLWRNNPFYEWPIAILADGKYVAPSPLGVLQRLSPQGLYFLGLRALDPDANKRAFRAFTNELGRRFESYVGEQLRLIQHASLHSETTYATSKKSVDYIIETPEVLVLVEVKSVAPSIDTRSGVFPQEGDVHRNIQRACNQISRTAELIQEGHTSFPALQNREMRGLVVTREHYFNLQMPFIREVIHPASVPTTVVSVQQLEDVIPALMDDITCGGSLLNALASKPDAIGTSLDHLAIEENPILKEIGDQWFEEHHGQFTYDELD